MCGIAGFTEYSRDFGGTETLRRMGDAISHRGPDAHGVFHQKNIGLCHRRLSIIDLSEAGNQPMISSNTRYTIVFNGEIYNYLELRETLKQQGYSFRTKTDTEVILALYEQDGSAVLDKLNGMFAFAIWDNINNTLFLARDRVGKKPLYYYVAGNDIVFGSELKALLTLSCIPRKIRLDAVYDFFAYQYIPDPKTIFEGIFKLEPGHFLEVSDKSIKKSKYWDISFKNKSQKNEGDLKTELLSILNKCTKNRMISDVPLGAFLSGGVDSSGIVAMMANNSELPITTCSIGFDNETFNETVFAKAVAEQYKTNHHELTVQSNVTDNLEKIVSYFDEPFADPSLVPTYFVSELARQKVTVAIAGDGGDEIFAGYEKYTTDYIENRLREIFPSIIRNHFFPSLSKFLSFFNNRLCQKAVTLLNSLSCNSAMGFYLTNSHMTDKVWNKITSDSTQRSLDGYHPSKITTDIYEQCDGVDHLSKILYTDMKTYLPGGILVKVDRMSMANSLEVRAPILDYSFMEFAATVPSNLKLKQREKKYLLKEAFKTYLPESILYRKKMGFSVPLAEWLRTEIKELTEKTLFSSTGGLSDYFKMDEIRNMWHEHQSQENDHSTPLWTMLMFQMWWNRYIENYK